MSGVSEFPTQSTRLTAEAFLMSQVDRKGANMADDITELTPSVPSGDVIVWLTTMGADKEGQMITNAHPTEEAARAWVSNPNLSNFSRFAAITSVRIPRALIKERWTNGV